jgi:hypothetical protein
MILSAFDFNPRQESLGFSLLVRGLGFTGPRFLS